VVVALSSSVVAQSRPSATKSGFTGDPKGLEILHGIEAAFDREQTMYLEIASTQTLSGMNMPQQTTAQSGRVWAHKPSQVVWQSNGKLTWNIICDGKSLCMYLPSEKLYTLQPIDKKKLDQQVAPLTQQYGITLAHLMWNSTRGTQPVALTRGEDLGLEDMPGGPLRHVRIGAGMALLDLWLDARNLPTRIMETQQYAGTNSTVVTAIKWITGQPIPDSTFAINPPSDARNVNALVGLPKVQMPGMAAEQQAAAPAPTPVMR
jgi:outer membrane lipoprotein-sorting protein